MGNNDLRRLMRAALGAAHKSDCNIAVGAAILVKKSIYSFCNMRKSACFGNDVPLSRRTGHAEMRLLKRFMGDRDELEGPMLVVRRNTLGLAMSRPCEECQKLLDKFPRLVVYYTDNDGRVVRFQKELTDETER